MAHKLLLADDSVTIQRVIELTFADEDVQVIAVGDGQQAIVRLESDRPDVVLADVGMPEQDGYEVAAYVKRTPHLSHIPVVLLTGAFEPVDEPRARAAGADGVLVKPFEPQMVINRVKELLAGRRPASLWTTPLDMPGKAEIQGHVAAPPPLPAAMPPAAAMEGASEGPAESIEEYFDRLDAAFDAFESGDRAPSLADFGVAPQARAPGPEPAREPVAPSAPPADDPLRGWDPSLEGDEAVSPATIGSGWLEPTGSPEPPAEPVAMPARETPTPSPWSSLRPAATAPAAGPAIPAAPAAAPASPSLSDAFGALLAAEQGHAFRPPTPVASPPLTDEAIDTVVRRVLEKVTTDAVRDTVVEVAERLVREEIARIKSAAH